MPKKHSTLPCAEPATVPPEVLTTGEAGVALCARTDVREESGADSDAGDPLARSLLLIMTDFPLKYRFGSGSFFVMARRRFILKYNG